MHYRMLCNTCGKDVAASPALDRCAGCPGTFRFEYDLASVRLPPSAGRMWDYADLLPLDDPSNRVTLGEGGTPLLESRSDHGCRVWWKVEAQNPTGSQKDRALCLAVSKAKELGFHRCIIVSTGSAGLACSAYTARAGMGCVVLVPQGTPEERLIPMQTLGARVVAMSGTLVEMDDFVARLKARPGWCDCTTQRAANPFQIEAPKTIAYEIFGDLGRAPDWLVVPVGGGTTLFGIWQGFRDLATLGRIDRLPHLVSVQPRRFNTIEVALERGLRTHADLKSIAMDETVATVARNLKAGVPSDGDVALDALRESQGLAISVTDDMAVEWQTRLGRQEGIFCEPSSAVAAAGIAALNARGTLKPGDDVVCILTGSGLREVSSAGPLRLVTLDSRADVSALEAAM